MYKQSLWICLFLLAALLVGCFAEPETITSEINPTVTIEIVADVPQPTVLPTSTSLPVTPTIAFDRETAVNPTISPMETQVPQPAAKLRDCPTVLPADAPPLLSNGSILYIIGQADEANLHFFALEEHSDVLALSANSLTPMPVYTIPSSNPIRVSISPDGTKLLRFEWADENGSYAVVYDLISKEEIYSDEPLPHFSGNWLPDGRIEQSRNWPLPKQEQAHHFEFAFFDMNTQSTESLEFDLLLPNYHYYQEPLYAGIASIDPTRQLILYSAFGEGSTSDVVLRDIGNGIDIWYQKGSFRVGYLYPFPLWVEDGSSVVFSMPVTEDQFSYDRIFSLTRNGTEMTLPVQPYPGLDQNYVRYLNFPSTQNYIHYTLQETLETGSGYIVDIHESWVGEICSDNGDFIVGRWMAEDQFAYTVFLEGGGQSLHLLDIPTWTSQKLAQLPPGEGFVVYGWTPLELPSPQ
ncbi:hypothetical protein [Candidatus Leptofilum sp.]|uniref:hypothetical protein n=1 Tax=Candidatus Leptofilum sp. TaxID=3241576 RepID=UPI003B59DE07